MSLQSNGSTNGSILNTIKNNINIFFSSSRIQIVLFTIGMGILLSWLSFILIQYLIFQPINYMVEHRIGKAFLQYFIGAIEQLFLFLGEGTKILDILLKYYGILFFMYLPIRIIIVKLNEITITDLMYAIRIMSRKTIFLEDTERKVPQHSYIIELCFGSFSSFHAIRKNVRNNRNKKLIGVLPASLSPSEK